MTANPSLAAPPIDPAVVPPLPVLSPPRALSEVSLPLPRQDLTGSVAAGNNRLHEAAMRADARNLGRIDAEETAALKGLRDLIDLALEATPDQRQRMRDRVRGHIGETGRRLAALDRRRGQAEQWAEDHAWDEMRRLKHESEGWFDCPGGEG